MEYAANERTLEYAANERTAEYVANEREENMKCVKCGTENEAGAKFCAFCGDPLEESGAGFEAAKAPEGKKRNGKKIAIAAAAVIVAGGAAFAAVKLREKDPKDIVIAAFENIHTEDQVNPNEELFGISAFLENAGKVSCQSGFRLVLEDCSEERVAQAASGAGLRVETKSDLDNKKYSLDAGVIFQNMDLVTMELYYGDKILQAAVPELSSKVFTADLGDGLAQRIEDSPLAGSLVESYGIDVEGIQQYLEDAAAQIQENSGTDPYDIVGLLQRYKDGCQAQENFKAALTVEKAGKASFQLDGSEVSCRGYQVHISKDSMISFLRDSSDFFLQDEELKEKYLKQLQLTAGMMELMGYSVEIPSAEEMMEDSYEQAQETVDQIIDQMEISLNDIDMLVYVDKKGRLAAVDGSTTVLAQTDVADALGAADAADAAGVADAAGATDAADSADTADATGSADATDSADAADAADAMDAVDAADAMDAAGVSVRVEFDVEFQGGTYLTENMTAEAELFDETDSSVLHMKLDKTGSYDGVRKNAGLSLDCQAAEGTSGVFSYESSYDAGTGDCQVKAEFSSDSFGRAQFELAGIVDELVKGESVHMEIDKLYGSVYDAMSDDEDYFTLSGDWHYGPLTDEIEAPEGTAFDVIAAGEDDWQSVMMEVYMKSFGLLGQLGSVISY